MAPITKAASILLIRNHASEQIFLVTRSEKLRFMGGFTAFPGGKLDPEDITLSVPEVGLDARRVCAVRELFEETGVLIAP